MYYSKFYGHIHDMILLFNTKFHIVSEFLFKIFRERNKNSTVISIYIILWLSYDFSINRRIVSLRKTRK
jgi:hypothetical protein